MEAARQWQKYHQRVESTEKRIFPSTTDCDRKRKSCCIQEKEAEAVPVVLLMDRFGYVKTVDNSVYERNKEAADSENKQIVPCMSDGKICLFTDNGQMHLVKVADIPYGKFRDKGIPVDNISNYDSSSENIISVMALEHIMDKKLLFVTEQSMCKVVSGAI